MRFIIFTLILVTIFTWEVDNMEPLKEQLILHEGLKLNAYKCPAGKWTIGVGRNLEANPLSKDEVLEVLKEVGITEEIAIRWLEKKIRQVKRQLANYEWYTSQSEIRRRVLIDMAFNLGVTGLLSFQNMIGALEVGNYEAAAKEMLESRWAEQVGKRAERLALMMETNKDYKEW